LRTSRQGRRLCAPYANAKRINTQPTVTKESKRILFGQTAASETREKRLGATLETVTADRERNVLAFRKTLEPVRTALAAQPYVGGGAPAYADYAVFGCFQWARCTSSFPLLLKDDPVWAWRERLLSAFDGFAGQALGYPV